MGANALEIKESIDVLKGSGPADVRELTLELGADLLLSAGVEQQRTAVELPKLSDHSLV